MELKIVKRPLQQKEHTSFEELEHVYFITQNNELKKIIPEWCVETYQYKESEGGMSLWIEDIKKVNPDVIYLYEIKTIRSDDNEIYYLVRADMKKVELDDDPFGEEMKINQEQDMFVGNSRIDGYPIYKSLNGVYKLTPNGDRILIMTLEDHFGRQF